MATAFGGNWSRVGAYVESFYHVTMTAFDAKGNVVGTAENDILNVFPTQPADLTISYEKLEIDAPSIASVSIGTGDTTNDPSSIALDDFFFAQSITIIPTSMSFAAHGDVNYGYTIANADLPKATTVDLYWASGTTTASEIGSPIVTTTTKTAQGTYPLQAPASDFADPPTGAKYLLAVADPENQVSPADPSKVADLALASITPTLVTTASPAVTLGTSSQTTLTDTAVLSGGHNPTGTITFTLSGPSGPVDTETVTVDGNSTYTTPTGYTLPTSGTVAGSYTWSASYGGDDNNKDASDQGGSAEQTVVSPASPTLTTTASPAAITLDGSGAPTLSDSAVLSGGYHETGSITFTLSGPGGFSYTQTDPVSGDETYTASTPLPTTGTVAGTYTWSAKYTSDDDNNKDANDQSDSAEQTVVTASQSDIIPVSMAWNYTDGGVDLAYKVDGAGLPQQVTVNFYWSNQNTPVFQPGETSVFTPAAPQKLTFQSQGPHPLHVSPSDFTTPLPGTYYLIAVFNYPAVVNLQSGSPTAAVALRPALLPPTVAITVSPDAPQKGLPYEVTVKVTNNAPLKLDYKIDWRELFQDPADLRDAATGNTTGPETDGYDIGTLGFKESRPATPIPIPFVTTWDWIDKTNPITGSSDKVLNDALEKVTKEIAKDILKNLDKNASEAVSFILNEYKALNVLYGTRSASLLFDARVESTVTYTPPSPGFDPTSELALQLSVPDGLTKTYQLYLLNKTTSDLSLTEALTLLKKPTPANVASATPLLTIGVAARVEAAKLYDQAVDPPDPNYTTLATPVVPVIPEVDELPDGIPKQLAQAALEEESFIDAAATSQNRAAGAAQASNAVWESRQYAAAAADFASAAALEPRISALLAAVEDSAAGLPAASPADVTSFLDANGLPQPMGDLFSRLGLTTSQINNVFQDLTQSGPDQFTDPQLGTGMLEIASILTASLGQDDLNQAVALDTGSLGMTARALSGSEQQTLGSDQEAIQVALTGHSSPSDLSQLMTKFALDVNQVALSTNNLAALQTALGFSVASIVQAQQGVTDLQPALGPIADQTVNLGTSIRFAADGTVGNGTLALTYSLDPGAPAGATINPTTGAFTWTPTAPGSYSLTVRAIENSSPPLSAAQTFTITVIAPPLSAPSASGFGAGRDAFVTVLYHDDLNRLPEPSGLRFWSRTLYEGAKPLAVAGAIWHSREHRALQSLHLAPATGFRRSFLDAMRAGWQAEYKSRLQHAHST
ncbi:MAG: putative Ig domain-containing protein [Isosphaeraceae bacterium]